MDKQIERNVKSMLSRPLEEEDGDSDATYCSAIEEHNIIHNTSPEDNNSNEFQLQNDRNGQFPYNVNEEKIKLQPSTYTGIIKNVPKTSQRVSPCVLRPRSQSENCKHIQRRLADIREEVTGWLTGWGKEPQASQLEQLVTELQHLHTTINASSFPNLKENVLQEMKQVAEKLEYQLNSILNEIVNDFGNSCCNFGCSCNYNEYAGNATTETPSHKLNISSRDPRLHSIAYYSVMSSKAPAPGNSKAQTNMPSYRVDRSSIKKQASTDALSYSADMFHIDSLGSERKNDNYLTQDSTKPGDFKSITSTESVSLHTNDCNSKVFALRNQNCTLTAPMLPRNREELSLDCIRNQFQECSLANSKGTACNNIVTEEMNNDNQFIKLNKQDGPKIVNPFEATISQSTLCEIKENTVSIEHSDYKENNMRASLLAKDLKNQSLVSEFMLFEVMGNSSPPQSNQRNQNGSTECEKCSITLSNNSKDPLSVDIFASCPTAFQIQNDKDINNALPIHQVTSKLNTAASPIIKKYEQHRKSKIAVPSESSQRIQSVTLNTEQTLSQLDTKCTYSKGYSEMIPSSKNKRLQKDSVSQSDQISHMKKSSSNIIRATKSKAKRIGKSNDTQKSGSLSLDMFASDTQTFTVSENKISNVNGRSLKCSKMALSQVHENHTLNVSKQVEPKQGSLAYCIKRIRLPCPSEYCKNSGFISNFWNGSPYPLPQEIKVSVESW